jgi:predicted O-methyltransferase YrrM
MHFFSETSLAQKIPVYFSYYLKAGTKHSLHPPFLSELIGFVFDPDRIYYDFNMLAHASAQISSDFRLIPLDEFSNARHQSGISISSYYNRSRHSASEYERLYRLSLFLKPDSILELGSSVGMSGLALALASKQARMITVEGNSFLTIFCNKLFYQNNLNQIQCKNLSFDSALSQKQEALYDLVFLDGDHEYHNTIKYTKKILDLCSDTAVIVMDDIHWSSGMYKSWKELIKDPRVQCSLETLRWGMLFKNKALTKGEYIYIPQKFKPWKIGLFQ